MKLQKLYLFSKNKPRTIPSGTGFIRLQMSSPLKDTPALANAKTGIIPNATYGDNLCSNFKSNDSLLFLILCGIVSASKTPAIVA